MNAKKELLIYFVVILSVFCLFYNVFFGKNKIAAAQNGSSFIVYDPFAKTVLSGQNENMPLEMASTTKIVTLIVALENLKDTEEYCVVCDKAAGVEGSSIYLKAGQKWKIKDLLYGMMLRSGNDAATQIAITACGSEENFVKKMNELAIKLRLKNTSFKNPTGLTRAGHYTSAYDLALLTAYGYEKLPLFNEIVSCKYHKTDAVYDGEEKTYFTFKNKNKLLFSDTDHCGVKTGYTKSAGRCYVGAKRRGNLLLIYVCLNKYDMWEHCAKSLDAGFKSYDEMLLANKGDKAGYVYCGETLGYIPLYFEQDLRLYIKKSDVKNLSYRIEKYNTDSKNKEKYQYMQGFLKVYYDNNLIFTAKLCNNINKYYKEQFSD